jgi:hypothetical protein
LTVRVNLAMLATSNSLEITVRSAVAVCAFLFLVGCGSYDLALTDCSTISRFPAMWGCFKNRLAYHRELDVKDLGPRFVAIGDSLAEQVQQGTMTDAQAKAAFAALRHSGL